MSRLFLLVALLLSLCVTPAFADLLTAPEPSPLADAGHQAGSGTGWFGNLQSKMNATRADLQRQLGEDMGKLADGGSSGTLWMVLALCFLYGVFHAAAPGHGKTIVAAYFIGRQAHWLEGITAGLIFAVGHSFTASLIVVVLAGVMQITHSDVLANTNLIAAIGYGLIAFIGAVILYQVLFRADHGCCTHADDYHGHKHDHHDHGHDHAHHHHHAMNEVKEDLRLRGPDAWQLFVSAGAAPCTGTVLVLLFALANGILWVGMLGAVAIALGMWLFITAVGIVTILLRSKFLTRLEKDAAATLRIRRLLRGLSGILIILTGGLLCLSAINGL